MQIDDARISDSPYTQCIPCIVSNYIYEDAYHLFARIE